MGMAKDAGIDGKKEVYVRRKEGKEGNEVPGRKMKSKQRKCLEMSAVLNVK